jgi:uncharacterized protein involved in exopolysaccharide biosynthesis
VGAGGKKPRLPSAHLSRRDPAILDRDEISLVALAHLIRRERRLIVGCGVGLAILVAVLVLLWPREYTSTATFMPQSSDETLSRLSGIAAEFGVTVPGTDPGDSPAFYASLLTSRDILRAVVLTAYPVSHDRGDSARVSLVELYEVEGESSAIRRDRAVERFLEDLDIEIERETKLIRMEVTTPWPSVSQGAAQRLLDLVSRFNLTTRQTQAGAERRFVQTRLEAARGELRAAEARLQTFLQRNREFRDSPALVFENDRLTREVELRQQVVTSLVQSFEQARIDEVRNTPVTTIVEPPDLPPQPDPRRLVLKTLLGLTAGLLSGTFLGAVRDFSRRTSVSAVGPRKTDPTLTAAAASAPDPSP